VAIELVFETHSMTEDNEQGRATGWLPGRLSQQGWVQARRREHLDSPYPGGESWRQAVARVGRFPGDLPLRWNGQRVLVIGHVATRWGLDHLIDGVPLEDPAEADFAWKQGWEYRIS
jgi:broad specificity phosphatase PhoE